MKKFFGSKWIEITCSWAHTLHALMFSIQILWICYQKFMKSLRNIDFIIFSISQNLIDPSIDDTQKSMCDAHCKFMASHRNSGDPSSHTILKPASLTFWAPLLQTSRYLLFWWLDGLFFDRNNMLMSSYFACTHVFDPNFVNLLSEIHEKS